MNIIVKYYNQFVVKNILILSMLVSTFNFSILLAQNNDSTKAKSIEEFSKIDNFIRKYAPSDSALQKIQNLATRHHINGRSAVARELYNFYKHLFPNKDSALSKVINDLEIIMLTQTPQSDVRPIYESFIEQKKGTINGFLSLQRLTDDFINRKQWDSAIFIYEKYYNLFPERRNTFDKILEILKAPTENLIIHNLGSQINTTQNEWDPNPTPDGRYLYFSSNHRNGGNGNDDVWYCEMENGVWSKPKNPGSRINGKNDETIDNVTIDGTGLLLSGTFQGTFGKFDIYMIEKDSIGWSELYHFPYPINTIHTDESGYITSDGNALIFTSDRPGGIGPHIPFGWIYNGGSNGNMDIYISMKTDTGWSQPINLGPTINTPYAERSAYLHPDGKTLYFSSDGHLGLGRLDVFKSVRLNENSWTEWSVPINLGKEINSANDDWGYKIGITGDSAFFSALNRIDGYGGWDLYSISLPKSAKPEKVVTIKGRVLDSKGKPLSAVIKWENLETSKQIGILKSDPRDGYYFIALPLGVNYGYYAEKSGYYPISNNINLNKINNLTEITEDIILTSIKEMKNENAKIRINNIFFDFDKSELKRESFPELDRLVDFILKNKPKKVKIEGHTDNSGSIEYNNKLSYQRAEAVFKYLISKGIDENILSFEGFGMSKPIVENKDELSRAKNRRVEIWFDNNE